MLTGPRRSRLVDLGGRRERNEAEAAVLTTEIRRQTLTAVDGEGALLREVADALNVTEVRASQILKAAREDAAREAAEAAEHGDG